MHSYAALLPSSKREKMDAAIFVACKDQTIQNGFKMNQILKYNNIIVIVFILMLQSKYLVSNTLKLSPYHVMYIPLNIYYNGIMYIYQIMDGTLSEEMRSCFDDFSLEVMVDVGNRA